MSLKSVLNDLGDAIREKTGTTEPMTLEEMAEQVRNLYGFRVTGYASTEAMEADAPEENTIGVITETEITGWLISGEMEEDMAEGAVWIRAGSGDVRFTALSPNGIRICPDLCRQMAEGTAELRDAYIYQAGVWVPFAEAWDGYYFNAGEQYADITGGWTSEGYGYNTNYTAVAGSVGDALGVSLTAQYTAALVGTANKVDLTDINSIIVTVSTSSAGTLTFRVLSDKGVASAAEKSVSVANKTGEDVTIDVSDLTGEYYLALCAAAGSTTYYISAAVSAVRAE